MTPLIKFFLNTQYNPTTTILKSYIQNKKNNNTKNNQSNNPTNKKITNTKIPKKTPISKISILFKTLSYFINKFILNITYYIHINTILFINTLLITFPLIFTHFNQLLNTILITIITNYKFITTILINKYKNQY